MSFQVAQRQGIGSVRRNPVVALGPISGAEGAAAVHGPAAAGEVDAWKVRAATMQRG